MPYPMFDDGSGFTLLRCRASIQRKDNDELDHCPGSPKELELVRGVGRENFLIHLVGETISISARFPPNPPVSVICARIWLAEIHEGVEEVLAGRVGKS